MKANSISGVQLGEEKLSKESKVLDSIPKDSLISVSCKGNAVITTTDKSAQHGSKEGNDFQSTLSRLNRKRNLRRKNVSKLTYRGHVKQNISLMTRDDRCFKADDFSTSNYIGERFIGILSGPEHIGRFG